MDTKWRKSKAFLGFVCFALGVSLVLGTLSSVWGNLLWGNGNGKAMLADALKSDFRETASYRSYLCQMMNRFIAMGAGGPISGNYYDYVDVSTEETVLIEAVAISGDYGWEEYKPTEADRERWKKEAQQYHEAIQSDRNILYIIKSGNEVLYTNLDSGGWVQHRPLLRRWQVHRGGGRGDGLHLRGGQQDPL